MEIRNGLTQDFEALAGKIGALKRHSGDVAAWMCEIGDKTAANRIVSHRKDIRNGPRRPLQRRNARSIRNNDIDVLLRERIKRPSGCQTTNGRNEVPSPHGTSP